MMSDAIVSLTLSQKDERKSLIKHLLALKKKPTVNKMSKFWIKTGSMSKIALRRFWKKKLNGSFEAK